MDRSEKRQYGTGLAQLAAGGALATESGVADIHVNRARDARVRRQQVRATGVLGGIDQYGRPVDPLKLSGKRGRNRPEGGRYPSPRLEAQQRFSEARKPFDAKLAKPLVRGKGAGALKLATMGGGLALAYRGGQNIASARGERIKKSDDELFDTSPQYGLGIPATRRNPISPLAMLASSSIMAGILVGAQGKHLSRGEKKAVRRGAYTFAGASGLLTQGVSGRNQVSR